MKLNFSRRKFPPLLKKLSPLLGISLLIFVFFEGCFKQERTGFHSGENGELLSRKRGERPEKVSSISFGSCAHQDKDQPLLRTVAEENPDLFIFLGDNIYGDTREMAVLEEKYSRLAVKSEFQELWDSTFVLATWDDHDYGENDAGKYYPQKEASKQIFMDFWGEPARSTRRFHSGIYHAEYFGDDAHRVQVLLLDTRTFRSDLLPATDKKLHRNDYRPIETPDSTLLGEMQWEWLEEELKKPAKVRIIASSTQFGISYNGYEAWANFPREQERMVKTIQETQANGVVFISGDVHYGELSRFEPEGCYPLYDLTSSGITQTWPHVEPNQNRLYEAEPKNNYGSIDIDWNLKDPIISLRLFNKKEKQSLVHEIRLSSLSF